MNKASLNAMVKEMAEVGAKYGFKVTPAGGTLGDSTAKLKFDVRSISSDGGIEVTARAKQVASLENLDISEPFMLKGKTYRVVDYNSARWKNPWITECSDGKTYIWTTASLRHHLLMKKVGRQSDGLAHLVA